MIDTHCGYCVKGEPLAKFGIYICDLSVSMLILFKEQSHPGRCIVAYKNHISEMTDMSAEERHAFYDDVARAAKAIHAAFHPDKINYGSYADTGCHLHVHLVPKYKDQFEWNTTFEMNPQRIFLSDEEYADMIEKIKQNLLGGTHMMDKIDVVKKIQEVGVCAVIRGKDAAEAMAMSDACIAGGVTIIELAFTTPQAHEVIAALSKKYADNPDVVIGAGTVLDAVTARIAILNGAQFIVSPAFDLETVKLCNRYRIAVMPGTTTLNGVIAALEAGADVIKIFPGEILGMKAIKAIHGPIPQAPLMPTGGVNAENAGEWIKAGCVAVGAGGALTGGGKTPAEITEAAKKFIASVKAARQ